MDGEAKACCRGRTGGGKGKQEQDAEEDDEEEGGCACTPSSSGTWRSTRTALSPPLPPSRGCQLVPPAPAPAPAPAGDSHLSVMGMVVVSSAGGPFRSYPRLHFPPHLSGPSLPFFLLGVAGWLASLDPPGRGPLTGFVPLARFGTPKPFRPRTAPGRREHPCRGMNGARGRHRQLEGAMPGSGDSPGPGRGRPTVSGCWLRLRRPLSGRWREVLEGVAALRPRPNEWAGWANALDRSTSAGEPHASPSRTRQSQALAFRPAQGQSVQVGFCRSHRAREKVFFLPLFFVPPAGGGSPLLFPFSSSAMLLSRVLRAVA